MVTAAKATSTLAACAPKLSSRLGGFHLIILAAFTLLGFYVCFNQIKGLRIDLLTLKALLQDPKRSADHQNQTTEGGAPDHKVEEPFEQPADEDFGAEDIQDAGLRDMLSDLVNAAAGDAQGVTIIVGDPDEGPVEEIVAVEEVVDEVLEGVGDEVTEAAADEGQVDDLSTLSVKDLRAMATEKGVAIKAGSKKADIVALIRESETGA